MLSPVLKKNITLKSDRGSEQTNQLRKNGAKQTSELSMSKRRIPSARGKQKMINQYSIVRKLGEGAYSKVQLCRNEENNQLYAIKLMNKRWLQGQRVSNTKSAYESVQEELKVLQRLDHPNIIWLEEIIDDPSQKELCVVTDYHSRGSIGDLIGSMNTKARESFKEAQSKGLPAKLKTVGLAPIKVKKYLKDIVFALYYCHSTVKVIHRDIKPDNIVINNNFEAVLIDFGVCALVEDNDDTLKSTQGSYMFYAPEMVADGKTQIRGERTDIWALGITLYFMLTGQYPYEEAKTVFELSELIKSKKIDFSIIKHSQAREVVEGMLNHDQEKRLTIP